MVKEKNATGKDTGGGGGEKKADAAGAALPIVLKVDLHCGGCARKVRKAIKHAPGVKLVAEDMAAGTVVVIGPADAAELKERIETRTKKPVQIVSAGAGPPMKDKEKKADTEKEKGGGGDKKAAADKTNKEGKKEPKEEKVMLKIEFCGVKNVVIDAAKDLVKVTGTIDAAADGGGDKKDNKQGAGDKKGGNAGDKKDGGGADEKKGKSSAAAPTPGIYPSMPPHYGYTPYPPPAHYGGYYDGGPAGAPAFYPNAAHQYPPPLYPYAAANLHAPQMFSDENPNPCSVM